MSMFRPPSSCSVFRCLLTRGFSVKTPLQKVYDVASVKQFKESVLSTTSKPVLVSFHAQWCGPCKEMMPIVESVVNSQQEAVDLARVDVDMLLNLSMEYDVTAVPSILVFERGSVTQQVVGLQSKEFITDLVKKLIKK